LSLLPAVLVISVIRIPYLTKATEMSLNQVPSSCRDGAEALARPVLVVIILGRVVVAISRRHSE
jgi:ABC-type phosphate transport system permease subunit